MVAEVLHNADSYVRIMDVAHAFSENMLRNVLQLRNIQTGEIAPHKIDKETGEQDSSATYSCTRVYRGVGNTNFFEEAILPSLSSVMNGESMTIIVSGPRESGRSSTLYGSGSNPGILSLTMEELQRVMKSATASNHATITTSSFVVHGDRSYEEENIPGQGEATSDDSSSTPSSSTSQREVPLIPYAEPFQTVALPSMELFLPTADRETTLRKMMYLHRPTDSSVITQFHIYNNVPAVAPSSSSSSSASSSIVKAFSILTFVDLAPITAELCPDVAALRDVLAAIANGTTPNFKVCKLTQVLERALIGPITLKAITTVTGRASLFHDSAAALQLAQSISKVQQVLTLIRLHTPKSLLDSLNAADHMMRLHQQALNASYQRGVYETYEVAVATGRRESSDVQSTFDALLAETKARRSHLASQLTAQLALGRTMRDEKRKRHAAMEQENATLRADIHREQLELQETQMALQRAARQHKEQQNEKLEAIAKLRSEVYEIRSASAVREEQIKANQSIMAKRMQECEDLQVDLDALAVEQKATADLLMETEYYRLVEKNRLLQKALQDAVDFEVKENLVDVDQRNAVKEMKAQVGEMEARNRLLREQVAASRSRSQQQQQPLNMSSSSSVNSLLMSPPAKGGRYAAATTGAKAAGKVASSVSPRPAAPKAAKRARSSDEPIASLY